MTVGNTAGVQAALRLQGVELRRYGRTILTEVDLEVPRGGKWVLFGPNGIGKSSLVQMMATRAFPHAARSMCSDAGSARPTCSHTAISSD